MQVIFTFFFFRGNLTTTLRQYLTLVTLTRFWVGFFFGIRFRHNLTIYHHSDLEHFRCNRVYVPWLNKGPRKTDFAQDVKGESILLSNPD